MKDRLLIILNSMIISHIRRLDIKIKKEESVDASKKRVQLFALG